MRFLPPKYHYWLLLSAWLLMQLALYTKLGAPKVMVDSERLIGVAQSHLADFSGNFEGFYELLYLSYSGLLSLVLATNLSLLAVVALQLLVSAFALIALYKSVLLLTRSAAIALLMGLFAVFFWELQQWNFYILTESLFIHLHIIWLYLLIRFKDTPRKLFIYSPLLLFLCLLRPMGFTIVLASLAYFAPFGLPFFKSIHKVYRWLGLLACTGLLLLLANAFSSSFKFMSTAAYEQGELVYGIATLGLEERYPALVVEAPPITAADDSLPSLLQLAVFAGQHPLFFLKLCFGKAFYFFVHAKPYYSLLHNALIMLLLYPLYLFALIGYREASSSFLRGYAWVMIGLQTAIVMLTTEDWDGRFLLPLVPLFMLLASTGMKHIFFKKSGSADLKTSN